MAVSWSGGGRRRGGPRRIGGSADSPPTSAAAALDSVGPLALAASSPVVPVSEQLYRACTIPQITKSSSSDEMVRMAGSVRTYLQLYPHQRDRPRTAIGP